MLSFILSLILFMLLFVVIKFIKRKGRLLIIIFTFWGSLFLLYAITPIQYVDLNIYAFLLLLSSFLMFFIGYVVSLRPSKMQIITTSTFNHKRVVFVFLLYLLIAVLAFQHKLKFIITELGSLKALIYNLYLIRESNLHGDLALTGISKVFEILILPSLFISCIFLFSKQKKYRVGTYIAIAVMLLFQMTSMSRGFIVYFIFIIGVFYYLLAEKREIVINKKKISIAVLALVLVFQTFSIIRTRNGEASIVNYTQSIISYKPWVPEALKQNHFFQKNIHSLHYITSGIYGLSSYIENSEDREILWGGGYTFRGIKSLFHFLSGQAKEKNEIKYKLITFPTNTNVYTFFRELLDDFGFFGTIIVHFLWGFLLGRTYQKYLDKPNYKNLIFPVTLTSWYLYGAYIMQTVFVSSVLWPVITYAVISFFERKKLHAPTQLGQQHST